MDYHSGPVQEFYHPASPEGQDGEERPPPYPPRPHHQPESLPAEDQEEIPPPQPQPVEDHGDEKPPPYPPRPQQQPEPHPVETHDDEKPPPYPPRPDQQLATTYQPPPPPRRTRQVFSDDDPSNPIHYTRDPHKLIAYLIPFPKPALPDTAPDAIPDRFIIYTPPPPPLSKPAEGEKEERMRKVQRKWQEEVREAKTSTAKTASWKGIKSRATRTIDWAVNQTTSSNLDFINRLGGDGGGGGGGGKQKGPAPADTTTHDHDAPNAPNAPNAVPDDSHSTAKKTVGLTEMVIVYPPSSTTGATSDDPEAMRAEFVSSMLRTKTKAQRDAVLATGLLPVSFAVDVLATVVWPFGGLVEMDAVWMYSSMRGAKIARSTTRRLASSSSSSQSPSTSTAEGGGGGGDGKTEGETGMKEGAKEAEGGGEGEGEEGKLKLTFTPSRRLDVLRRYLAARCHERDPKLFASAGGPSPTETEVLEAIGWAPSQTTGERRNWEDEQWEVAEVKDDFRQVVGKGAREWDRWCKAFVKDPEKALKK